MENNKIGLNSNEIFDIEIELTGYCNLKCPLCANQNKFANNLQKKNIRPFYEWEKQLNLFPSIKSVCIAGIFSEPTLYPELFQLLNYFTQRKISIELYTNGNTNNQLWWNKLNKKLTKNDKVIFTICGSTQEIHEKYRKGSNLKIILDNVNAFQQNNKNNNDWIQFIKFQYNIDDLKNMDSIIKKFNNKIIINSSAYNERFNICNNSIFNMPNNLSHKYCILAKDAFQRKRDKKDFKIQCKSLETNFISIDQFGKYYPCFLYRIFSKDKFNLNNYSDILNYKYDFCYECEKYTLKMLQLNGLERMM